jgi:hypothetical protein
MTSAPLNAKAFGALGNGTTVDYTALLALVTAAKTQVTPHVVIPPGTYNLGANLLLFDLPNGATLDCQGEFLSTVSSGPAIRLGRPLANTYWLTVRGLKVRRSAVDTSAGSVGIEVRNLVCSRVDVRRVEGFQDGLVLLGDESDGGCSYCEFSLGYLQDNKRNLVLSASGSGYCNENNFYGGSFSHSTTYPSVATVNLEIAHFVTSPLSNNRFFGPSFEDNDALAVAAVINGANNALFHPRMERSTSASTYEIQFTANATECAVLGNGSLLLDSNIDDLGANTCYETREGRHISHQVADNAAKAVLSLQSTTSSDARLLRFVNSSGTVVGFVKGTGLAELKDISLTNLVDAADDTAAATAGVAVNQLYRNGSVVQVRVS